MPSIGQKIIRLDSVDSTNNYVAKMVESGICGDGTVILADEQTKGRGQRGNSWETAPGMNLIFSCFLVHEPAVGLQAQFDFSKMIALAVHGCLKRLGIESKIKWPNDILVHDQKIAGILIENQLSENRLKSSIVGIGLNVNQVNFEYSQATSIKQHIGQFTPIEHVLEILLDELNSWKQKFAEHEWKLIDQVYHSHLWKLNEEVRFIFDGATYTGKISGVNEHGQLLLTSSLSKQTFGLQEVKFI